MMTINDSGNMSTDLDNHEVLRVMLQQESKHYRVQEYQSYQVKAMREFQCNTNQKMDLIDESCRSKMLSWFQQICDFCQYDIDETIVIIENALNYMDRYVTTEQGCVALLDRNYYQCMSITCLYMGMKLHASAAICASDMSQITRNAYTTEQIEGMEYTILQALQWYVNPPTISVFVSEYVKCIMDGSTLLDTVESTLYKSVMNLVRVQTTAALQLDSMKTVPASMIAYSAIYNAIQLLVVQQSQSLSSSIELSLQSLYNMLQQQQLQVPVREMILSLQKIMCDILIEANHLPKNYKLHDSTLSPSSASAVCTKAAVTCSSNKTSMMVAQSSSPRSTIVVSISSI